MTGLTSSSVLGVRFIAEPFEVTRAAVREVLASPARAGAHLCPTGVHGVIEAQKDPEFRRILNNAAFNVPDGAPIVHMSRWMGFRRCERAFGPHIMLAILEDSVPLRTRHFLYGGAVGVASKLAQTLEGRLPGLQVVGTYTPPYRPLTAEEEETVLRQIASSHADLVWVGLSTPKQERWVAAMRSRMRVKLICSVGAAFDYHCGSIREAPRWMQRAALEWLFRLAQEPRRLWRRYAAIVPHFMALSALQLLGLKKFPDNE